MNLEEELEEISLDLDAQNTLCEVILCLSCNLLPDIDEEGITNLIKIQQERMNALNERIKKIL